MTMNPPVSCVLNNKFFSLKNYAKMMLFSCFIKIAELRIISREKWKAMPPTDPPIKLELPAIHVVIAHTVTANCIDEV